MDICNPEVWLSHLLANLPEEKLGSKLSDDNPQWEYIDGEIVKLGSLNHALLDLPKFQQQGLMLLTSESKDFRLVSHLLRTLQHAGNPLLAFQMLTQYVSHYWNIAWPQNAANKKRFADQILKRFESGITGFTAVSSPEQRDALLGEIARLAQCWQTLDMMELSSATDDLLAMYQRAFRDYAPAQPVRAAVTPDAIPLSPTATVEAAAPMVIVDSHDDKAWRDTLLKVAGILCERQPESPLGYRLRRQALWQNITSAPQSEDDGRTPLAAVSADMVADYQSRLTRADAALWQQVEKSLLLAPFWLDGHYLSSHIAQLLGHDEVAQAVRDEVRHFLTRLPQLDGLRFNDRSPFIGDATRQWLVQEKTGAVGTETTPDDTTQQIWNCYQEQGLESALALLEQQSSDTPRAHFYRQYLAAQLMEAAGMAQLAQHHYRMLLKTGLCTALPNWEPALLEQLKGKLTAEL